MKYLDEVKEGFKEYNEIKNRNKKEIDIGFYATEDEYVAIINGKEIKSSKLESMEKDKDGEVEKSEKSLVKIMRNSLIIKEWISSILKNVPRGKEKIYLRPYKTLIHSDKPFPEHFLDELKYELEKKSEKLFEMCLGVIKE